MRMWNVKPEVMCRKHLLGEHVEMHMFLSALTSGKKLDGYIRSGFVEIHNIKRRHNELAQEMVRRGYRHNSPMEDIPFLAMSGSVESKRSYEELRFRCAECERRIQKSTNNHSARS